MDLNPFPAIARYIARSGKRVAVSILGFLVLLAGLVMLATPGPGVLIVIAGLAILANEYAWAERALDRAKQRTGEAVKVATASWWRIVLSVALTLLGIAAVVWWFFVR